MHTHNRTTIILLAAILALIAAGCGALNLAGEPAVVSTIPPRPTTPPTSAEIVFPVSHPDLTVGAAVFAQNCTRCHGPNGMGNGELVEAGQVPNPGDMTDWEAVAVDTPQDWFNIITVGNLENLMPPWAGSLSEEQRWAVAMYNYTRSYTPEEIERGGEIYATSCTECHGDDGSGAVASTPDLTSPEITLALSDAAIRTSLLSGGLAAHDTLELTDNESREVTMYTRTLSLDGVGATVGVETVMDELSQAGDTGNVGVPPNIEDAFVTVENATVSGSVSSGTEGGEPPSGAAVELHVFDDNFEEIDVLLTTMEGDRFEFSDVTVNPEYTYVALVTYENRQFISQPTQGFNIDGETLDLPVLIYEATDDASVLSIDSMAVQVTPDEDRLQVAQFTIFRNTSDRLYSVETTTDDGETIFTSATITLPPGAVVGGFGGNPDRYLLDAENFTVTDTQPILPGEGHMIQLVYFIPFDRDAIIEHPLDYDLNGLFRLLMSSEAVEVTSEQLTSFGPAEIGESVYQEYGGEYALAAGESIRYELQRDRVGSGRTLPYTLFALSAVSLLIAGSLFIYGRIDNTPKKQNERRINDLVDRIAKLDAAHESGEINHDYYQRERAELKAQLRAMMTQEDVANA